MSLHRVTVETCGWWCVKSLEFLDWVVSNVWLAVVINPQRACARGLQ